MGTERLNQSMFAILKGSIRLVFLYGAISLCSSNQAQNVKPVDAPGDPKVHLTQVQAQGFQTALEALAAQGHVTFVAEGTPLHAVLPAVKAARLTEPASLADAVARTAQEFDYAVQRQGSVFILKKRYTDAHDLPSVTLEECLLAMQDASRILDTFNPHGPGVTRGMVSASVLPGDFAGSLTPEQLLLMRDGTLPISSLAPDQQAKARRFLFAMYLDEPIEEVQNAVSRLRGAQKAVLCMGSLGGKEFFGYELPTTPQTSARKPVFVSFAEFASNMVFIEKSRSDSAVPVAVGGGSALSVSAGVPVPATVERKAAAEGATLGEVVAALNKRVGPRMAVDAALESKRMTLIGSKFAPTEQILAAVADIYGLRVKTENEILLRLTRRPLALPLNLAQLPVSLRQAFPYPLLRAVQDGVLDHSRQHLDTAVADTPEQREERQQILQKFFEDKSRIEGLPNALHQEAVSRLRADIAPQWTRSSGRIPVAGLSGVDQNIFAVALTTNFLNVINRALRRQPPQFIAQFDQLFLGGGLSPAGSGQTITLLFQYADAAGGKHTALSIGNLNYPGR